MAPTTERRLPPSQVNCKWWMRGYCARGKACHFKHDEVMFGAQNKQDQKTELAPTLPASAPAQDTTSAQTCAICFETPDTYGLLVNCDHAFCLECIRNWRATAPKNPTSENELKKTSKTCPMCRSHSDFIIPSSIWPQATEENTMKREIVDGYLGRLKTIPCRYFEQSIKDSAPGFRPKCQFANHCHYSHTHPITKEPYIFSEEELQRRPRRRRRSYMDEMAIMEMLFNDLTVGYQTEDEWVDADEEESDDFGDHIVFETEFLGLASDFEDFEHDYGLGWD